MFFFIEPDIFKVCFLLLPPQDKQLIQYTTCPLLAFLDGCIPPPDLDLAIDGSSTGSSSTQHEPSSSSVASIDAEKSSEIVDTSLESKQAHRSSLIRLEPLTEAEASEETLFYLCELSPAGPEADSVQLSRVWTPRLLQSQTVSLSYVNTSSHLWSSFKQQKMKRKSSRLQFGHIFRFMTLALGNSQSLKSHIWLLHTHSLCVL